MAPIAKAILKEDPNLETMRYELVPKVRSQTIHYDTRVIEFLLIGFTGDNGGAFLEELFLPGISLKGFYEWW